jgi:hypothetical protein
MSLKIAAAVGGVAAIIVPWFVSANDQLAGGALGGRIVEIPVGGGYELHWSWLVFCVVTLLAWPLLNLARQP